VICSLLRRFQDQLNYVWLALVVLEHELQLIYPKRVVDQREQLCECEIHRNTLSRVFGLCEVETGQSNIILDIEESRGTGMGQATTPAELPVVGDPFTEVALDLTFPRGAPLFLLNGKRLQLLRPLDRDADNLSHLVFQLVCTVRATSKKRTIPVIVRVSDVNDNAPEFIDAPYRAQVSENQFLLLYSLPLPYRPLKQLMLVLTPHYSMNMCIYMKPKYKTSFE
ncbi:Uncharacterized protein GBIM_19164, partial [Gryllus bimaculatus]